MEIIIIYIYISYIILYIACCSNTLNMLFEHPEHDVRTPAQPRLRRQGSANSFILAANPTDSDWHRAAAKLRLCRHGASDPLILVAKPTCSRGSNNMFRVPAPFFDNSSVHCV